VDIRRFHCAVPVDDLGAARRFYGGVLGCAEGRSTDHWIDWNLYGHQLVTHLTPAGSTPSMSAPPTSDVDGKQVPIPHLGVLLTADEFDALADRLTTAGVEFLIPPTVRFPGEPAEQLTMFFHDPAGNAMEFKSFVDESTVFARS
jgi:extradiol dioxygenase family protein